MKQLLCFVTLMIISLFPYKAFAQADITIRDHKNFVLQTVNDSGLVIANGERTVKLTGIYESAKKQYSIKLFDATDTLFKLQAPLNRVEFRNELTAALSKKDQTIKAFSEYSIEIVFLWVYSLKQDDGTVISGRLNLGYITQPFTKSSVINNPARVHLLEEINNRYSGRVALVNTYKKNFVTALDSLIHMIANKKLAGLFSQRYDDVLLQVFKQFDTKNNPTLDPDLIEKFKGYRSVIKVDTINVDSLIKKTRADADSFAEKLKTAEKQANVARDLIAAAQKDYDKSKKLTDGANEAIRDSLSKRDDLLLAMINVTKDEKERLDEVAKLARVTADSALRAADSIRSIKNFLSQKQSSTYVIDDSKLITDAVSDVVKLFDRFDTSRLKLDSARNEMREKKIFPIEKVSIQFERGHIERIQAWVQNEYGALDIYENIYAIGFSSINNLKAFQSTRLFIRKSTKAGFVDGIFLSDVLGNYDNILDLFTRDYSPGDTVVNEISPAIGPITLHKERNIRLFDSKIFSDLQGIQQDQPNGLVQIEVNRKLNLNTFRWQLATARIDYSWFSYMNVYGSINKIENKAKELELRNQNTIVNNVIVSPSYATNLDIRLYENASLGVDVNAFLFDWPDMKFTAYLDLGFRYGHVKVVDTVYEVQNGVAKRTDRVNRFAGNTFTFSFPKVTYEFFSERRVGFNLSYNYNHTWLFTNNTFKQVMSYAKSDLNRITTERAARNSHMIEVFLRAETSRDSNGQLFLRSRFFWQQGDANTFFPQMQVGYSYNIIFRK